MWGWYVPTQPAVPLHLSIPVAALIVAGWVLLAVFGWWVLEADPEPDGEGGPGEREATGDNANLLAAAFFLLVAVGLAIVPCLMVRNVAVGYRVAHESNESWKVAISLTLLVGSLFVVGVFAFVRAAWQAARSRPPRPRSVSGRAAAPSR